MFYIDCRCYLYPKSSDEVLVVQRMKDVEVNKSSFVFSGIDLLFLPEWSLWKMGIFNMPGIITMFRNTLS